MRLRRDLCLGLLAPPAHLPERYANSTNRGEDHARINNDRTAR